VASSAVEQPLRVALNLVFLVPGEVGGMETYARELIPRLARRGDVRLVCLVNREAAEAGEGPWGSVAPMEVVPVRARSRVEWVRGEQQYVPRLAARAGCHLIHSLASTAPLWGRVSRITTIHDLNYLKVPEAHFGLRGLGMRALVPAAARRSRRLVVDARSTADDLRTELGVPESKIDVVPLGVTIPPPPAAGAAQRARARLRIDDDRQLVLSVSAKRPHKNLERLLRALAELPPERRPWLVIPGYPTEYEVQLRGHAEALGIERDVRWPAWLPDDELEGLYAASSCLVFPSLYEGFGLPVLEAMARGVAVACSSRSSLPEVAGDAALLFDPEDVSALRTAMDRLLGDPGLRERLGDAGRERAAHFTWERTADLTAASYERTLRR
jgi:glycosyltransferase involved in cell wall biosynthesis